MADYKTMYYILFNEVTDIIEQLKAAQKTAEEYYVNSDKEDVIVLHTSKKKKL